MPEYKAASGVGHGHSAQYYNNDRQQAKLSDGVPPYGMHKQTQKQHLDGKHVHPHMSQGYADYDSTKPDGYRHAYFTEAKQYKDYDQQGYYN